MHISITPNGFLFCNEAQLILLCWLTCFVTPTIASIGGLTKMVMLDYFMLAIQGFIQSIFIYFSAITADGFGNLSRRCHVTAHHTQCSGARR